MIAVALVPVLLVAAVLGRTGHRVVARYDPALAVRVLVAGAATVAGATALVVYELLALVLSTWAPVASAGGWSGDAVADRDGALPAAAGPIVAGAAAAMAVGGVAFAARIGRRARTTRRFTGALDVAEGVAVVADPGAPAYAVPAHGGVVVLDARLLPQLDARERRAVLAHEQAHLRHRHVRYLNVTTLAATVNPLLRPLVDAVALGTERWADEEAAHRLGDRVTVARALAKVGLFQRTASGRAGAQLAMAAHAVPARVEQLLRPRRGRPGRVLLPVLAVAAAAAALTPAVVAHVIHEWWEAAGAGLDW
jgi:Zn-dependent protease with chaperone function